MLEQIQETAPPDSISQPLDPAKIPRKIAAGYRNSQAQIL
jgi:hypothetical protein